ncbi:MAG: hypothetical protein WCH34_10160 [Bacteroidota bacterium]
MKSTGKVIGLIMWMGAGIFTFIFWFLAMSKWLGTLGIILSIILSPGIVIFPIIYWIVEGIFPTAYFIVWVVGVMGYLINKFSNFGD